MHEDNGRIYRTKIATKIRSWSGTLAENSDSSYLPELEAITRIAMILPALWRITIWTDSESVIKEIENYDPHKPPHNRAKKAGWK